MILKVVKKIFSDIHRDDLLNISKEGVGIYGGTSGLALFLTLLYHYESSTIKKEEILEQMTKQVSYSLNNLDKLEQNAALSGYAGVLWLLLVLKKQGVYDDLDEYIEQLTRITIESTKNDLKHHNYDLMHGLMGKLLILGRAHRAMPNPEVKTAIAQTISQGLEAILNASVVLTDQQEAYWLSPRLHEDVVSVGLAHGQASYIWALSAICQEGKAFINANIQSEIKQTIRQACNFLTYRMLTEEGNQTQVNLQNYFSVHQVVHPSTRHTLSWCNGGLGVCIALSKASELLEDNAIEKQAITILSALSKIKKEDSNIWQEGKNIDCGMCHGTLGVFFIFYILHRKFGSIEFKEAYEYWLNQAMNHICWNEPFLGMKVCSVDYVNDTRVMRWDYMSGLLNGAAGYGIILLSYYLLEQGWCNEEDLAWLNIFM
ncbi:lanthionine synthetase LanC family protein [uncultured Microscilla sp.]|uniref:lanthionine synthetase LanC family protein n=1 Tax=uncultured Microscilla sp. TaxID=432653 RepID=UPI0026252199|nr:lanthionine synthetase LanC family protein [uncultured Microscilla sp.]